MQKGVSSLANSIKCDPKRYLHAAFKLRNRILFTDYMILCCTGPWDDPRFWHWYNEDEHPMPLLYKLGFSIHGSISGTLSWENQYSIFSAIVDSNPERSTEYKEALISCLPSHGQNKTQPEYYRALSECKDKEGKLLFSPQGGFADILRNNLVLIPKAVAGVGEWANYFLCGKIKEEDLPWDINEEDW